MDSSVRDVNLDEMKQKFEVPLPPGRIDRITVIHPPRRNTELLEAIRENTAAVASLKDSVEMNARPAPAPPAPVTRQLASTPLDPFILKEADINRSWLSLLIQCARRACDREPAESLAGIFVPLRTGRSLWQWARAPDGMNAGWTTLQSDGTTRTVVAVNLNGVKKLPPWVPPDRALEYVISHELGHVRDLSLWGGEAFSQDELETRAEAFAQRMLAPSPPPPQPKRPPESKASGRTERPPRQQ